MRISANIIANCSDFVWSLDEPNLNIIQKAIGNIEKATNWGLYACPWTFGNSTFFPIDPEDVEIYEYEEDDGNNETKSFTELGVSLDRLMKKFPVACKKWFDVNLQDSILQDSIDSIERNTTLDTIKKRKFVPIVFARIGHIPNNEGVHFYKGSTYGIIQTLRINYSCDYCDSKLSISDDQPGYGELKFFGDVLRKVGGTFHHEDGGYSQADEHRDWFMENGYEDILSSEKE